MSLLCAFVIIKGFRLGFNALNIASRMNKDSPIRLYFLVGAISIISGLIFLVIYPFPFNAGLAAPLSMPTLIQSPLIAAQNPTKIDEDWYLLLKWLKEKTSDPGLDYYKLYTEPVIDKKTGAVEDYSYPSQAYSILSHWDYGHAIEYYGHRIPVANPFQQGIGKKENGKVVELGEGVFFLETDENKAISYLEQLKSRYVLTDAKFAILDLGYFNTIVKFVQGNMDGYINEPKDALTKYDNSMIARLHLLDGSQTVVEKKVDNKTIDLTYGALEHFRLLYESGTQVTVLPYKNSNKEIKMAKAFEYVKGAEIKGRALPGSDVDISTKVITNQGRSFTYENKIISEDGNFDFIVPYSTGKQENSDVMASEYTIKIGNYTKNIKVSEEDILQGKTMQINF